jgi:hypothetical protein
MVFFCGWFLAAAAPAAVVALLSVALMSCRIPWVVTCPTISPLKHPRHVSGRSKHWSTVSCVYMFYHLSNCALPSMNKVFDLISYFLTGLSTSPLSPPSTLPVFIFHFLFLNFVSFFSNFSFPFPYFPSSFSVSRYILPTQTVKSLYFSSSLP